MASSIRNCFQQGGLAFIRPKELDPTAENYLRQAEAYGARPSIFSKNLQASGMVLAAAVTSLFNATGYTLKAVGDPVLYMLGKEWSLASEAFKTNGYNALQCLYLTGIGPFLALGTLVYPSFSLSLIWERPAPAAPDPVPVSVSVSADDTGLTQLYEESLLEQENLRGQLQAALLQSSAPAPDNSDLVSMLQARLVQLDSAAESPTAIMQGQDQAFNESLLADQKKDLDKTIVELKQGFEEAQASLQEGFETEKRSLQGQLEKEQKIAQAHRSRYAELRRRINDLKSETTERVETFLANLEKRFPIPEGS